MQMMSNTQFARTPVNISPKHPHSYYGMEDDWEINLSNPLSREVMTAMNRMVVLDDRAIIAPATEYVTCIFDAMSGNVTSVIDLPASRALAECLRDVINAVIMLPEYGLRLPGAEGDVIPYQFGIPEDWGLLHDYEMAAMGYRIEGEQRHWDVALYYTNTSDAEADAEVLATRMNSYLLLNSFSTPRKS